MADDAKPDSDNDESDKEAAFFALMDRWADKREATKPKPKTNAPVLSILDALFG